MKKSMVFGLIGLCILSIFFAGCTSSGSTQVNSVPSNAYSTAYATPTTSQSDFQLIESHVETGTYGTRYVAGTIKNNNPDKTYSYVQVTINEYDSSGAQVGSTMANVNNLEAGGTWKFKAVVIDESATNFKVKEITGY